MIGVLGDSDTKDEILEGFRLINRGSDIATVDKLGKGFGLYSPLFSQFAYTHTQSCSMCVTHFCTFESV